jgi:tetratricopeptide (TPR) repeat protein
MMTWQIVRLSEISASNETEASYRVAALSEADIAALRPRLISRHYAARDVIWREGARGDCLGLVKRGRIAVYVSGSRIDGPTDILTPGRVFGEAMMTAGQASACTLRALTDVEVLFLRRADLLALLEQHYACAAGIGRPPLHLRWLSLVMALLLFLSISLAFGPTRSAWASTAYGVGLWFGQRSHWGWAQASWRLSQRLSPDWGAPRLSLGNLYARRGALDAAEAEFEQALTLTPDLAEAYNSLGLLYAAQHAYDLAIDAFRRALALEPGQAIVEGNLAISLHRANRQDEALRHYALARVLAAPHPDPALLVNEAIAYYEIGELDTAKSMARQVLDHHGDSAPAYTVLGAVEFARQHFEAAAGLLDEAVRLGPTYSPAYFYQGLTYRALNQPARAVAAFEHVLALQPASLVADEARYYLEDLSSFQDSGLIPAPRAGERR